MFTVFCMLFIVKCHVLMLEQRNSIETTPVMAVVVDPYIVCYHQHCFHWALNTRTNNICIKLHYNRHKQKVNTYTSSSL